MEPGYRFRLYLLTALVLVGIGVLLTRLHEFQIERRGEFLNQVPGNRTVTVREPGIRGEITDRNGLTLAKNLRNYEVSFNLDEIREAYLLQHANDPEIRRVQKKDGLDRENKEKDIVSIVNEWVIARLKKPDLELAKNYNANALRTHFLTHGGLIPFSYRADLTYEEFAKFAEHNLDLSGVYLGMRPIREYPYGSLASHVIGYLKQWEKHDVPDSATRIFDHYVGDDKGIAGIEASMDNMLRGLEGRKTIIKDEKGHTLRMSDYVKPGTGAKVRLTIDAPVQFLLENTLRLAGRAAGVVMDVNTGEVLAMASVPDYNPNDFFPSITKKQLASYNANKLAPLTNRAISQFSPGSTMKIPIAISAALAGRANSRYSCNGYVTYGNSRVQCWIYRQFHGTHGNQNLSEAIQHSCNPYFNTIANTIGKDALIEGCSMVNIGQKTGIELPYENGGMLPGSRAWRAAYPKAILSAHEIAMMSIGQGTASATPIQICSVAACVANGGKYYSPRIVKEATAEDGKVLIPDQPKLKVDLIQAGVKPADLELIRNGMRMSTNKPGGTSGKAKLPNIVVASKSGTAQIDNDFGKKSNISWVVSFAPYENPKYAICIMVQNAQSGGSVCGPLVNLVFRGLFARDLKGIRLPLMAQTKAPGYVGENIKSMEISPEMIAAVEAGDTTPIPAVVAAEPEPSIETSNDEEIGGDEETDMPQVGPPPPTPAATVPAPTITPEADDEGTVIPKAVPVDEH